MTVSSERLTNCTSFEDLAEVELTWDEFLALPFETRGCALIDGTVIVNPPSDQHDLLVTRLVFELMAWVRAGADRGEVSTARPIRVTARRGYQPDLMWYPAERVQPRGRDRYVGLPMLVVEVLSPSTRRFDLVRKQRDFALLGIAELWLVDPDEHVVVVHRRSAEDPTAYAGPDEMTVGGRLTSRLLPGFGLDLADLFA
jgi:Uma2 family endonuclease